ncbi:hypothetical protein J2W49_000812 [Hydrogenophaga palleronii]|uniref:Uncharacterized protein n=1 Tax=Hydrogenophaga palleronii TaxID=65655 RepID=A0ABU1WIK2_9BURK|nr:hypothetical protein [Hydrogenophaga palleronii]MDR7148884.1 hypothetical protein [Hydrogenophaga palleronii]
MKYAILSLSLTFCQSCFAQWAVFDNRVYEELVKINNVRSTTQPSLADFEEQAELSSDFATIELAERTRFITTEEDCGDRQLNEKHYFACQGLRNLRLKTLEQSESLLRVIQQRRTQIGQLIQTGRGVAEESGPLQRHHFELQGLQAQIQNDAMQLQVLMYGYKQREKMYEMQMAEARRVSDTRRPGSRSLGAVPFVPALMR